VDVAIEVIPRSRCGFGVEGFGLYNNFRALRGPSQTQEEAKPKDPKKKRQEYDLQPTSLCQ
jgi:hypothetical protein